MYIISYIHNLNDKSIKNYNVRGRTTIKQSKINDKIELVNNK